MPELPQGQIQVTRSVVVANNEPIIVEVFKDKDGKIVRQQSFTKDQLTATKAKVQKQYDDANVRLNEMLTLLV